MIKMNKPEVEVSYKISKTVETAIGFWRGDVDENEQYVLLTNGMENWKVQDKTKSKLYLFTLDGELKWSYAMGNESWGADLSRDGKYAAYVTSNNTDTLGVLDTATGKPIWVKKASDYKPVGYTGSVVEGVENKEIQISSSSKYVAIGDAMGNVFLTELLTGKILWIQSDIKCMVRRIVFDKADRYMYVGSGMGMHTSWM
ncbi:MAG: YncE family protein [Bacillota bacterium]